MEKGKEGGMVGRKGEREGGQKEEGRKEKRREEGHLRN